MEPNFDERFGTFGRGKREKGGGEGSGNGTGSLMNRTQNDICRAMY